MTKPMSRSEAMGAAPLALVGSEGRDGITHPVICEYVTPNYPPDEDLAAGLWRRATDEEYAAYVAYWDAFYEKEESSND